jgi:hypothetical protein
VNQVVSRYRDLQEVASILAGNGIGFGMLNFCDVRSSNELGFHKELDMDFLRCLYIMLPLNELTFDKTGLVVCTVS